MHPKHLRIEDFTYQLPETYIAQYPLPERDASKLLVYKNGEIKNDVYRNIADYLPENALVVFNETKVINVRLLFQKTTGAKIEIFCLEPDERYAEMQIAMSQCGSVYWKCMVGGANKWKDGSELKLEQNDIRLTVNLIEKNDGYFLIHFVWNKPEMNFAELLNIVGEVPLPPYMNRVVNDADKSRYQTIFATQEGSVAAPTAALHFSDYIFEQFKNKNIDSSFITLHVGAGTFKQVKAAQLEDHEMHAEWMDVSISFLEKLKNNTHPIIAVGTTAMRTLESLYWIGYKLHQNISFKVENIAVAQWDPYDFETEIDLKIAINSLINWMKSAQMDRLVTRTQIMIAPSYRPRIVNQLVTNFHQPNSTLLLLVAALVGDDWKRIYNYALENDFRFLSYGDGCLLQFS